MALKEQNTPCLAVALPMHVIAHAVAHAAALAIAHAIVHAAAHAIAHAGRLCCCREIRTQCSLLCPAA